MQSFHELSLAEQRRINELIDQTWQQSGELGAESSPANPPPRLTIPIAKLISGISLPPPDRVTPEQAELAASHVVKVLAKRGVVLKGAKWLGSKEYYRWLLSDFLPREVKANVAPHRQTEYHYNRLAPNSIDNIFRTIDAFIGELFRCELPPGARWLYRPSPGDRRLTPPRRRYLSAWQAAHDSVTVQTLRPVAVHDMLSGGVRVDFEIVYLVQYENGAKRTLVGGGKANLVLEKTDWRIRSLTFPGFTLPGR